MDLSAYELILELLSQSHTYGESAADKIELWISASFALIAMAYLAPDRLSLGTTALVSGIYVAFSAWLFTNISADLELSQVGLADARALAEEYAIESQHLTYRLTEGDTGSRIFGLISQIGLFLGTLGYIGFTARQTFKNRQQLNRDDDREH